MSNETSSRRTAAPSAASAGTSSLGRALPIALAALLGVFLVAGTGFAHTEAAHNAAHDTRHSLAFPCH
jgi:cobalt transporter subunit CbtB